MLRKAIGENADFVFPLFPPPEYFKILRKHSAINQGAHMGWKTSGNNYGKIISMMVVWKSTKLDNYPFAHQVVTLGNIAAYLTLFV